MKKFINIDTNNMTEEKLEVINEIETDSLLKKNIYDYGIDLIEDRVLADFRDGLKPAQRRILWAAKDLKAYFDSKTVKSARILGDTMGKYHPHGSAYSSLITMVNSEYPVMFGQGNWGSLTDDAAADRYTEAKISEIGMKMLECGFATELVPNYGGDLLEPIIIPTRFPAFFVNDCSGIGVGLNCNIPAHNLKEVVEALKVVLEKGNNTTIDDILKYIKGPDYKHGGKILSDKKDLANLYTNGDGPVVYECDYKLETMNKNVLLTINGYCPGFNPNNFITKMIKLIDQDIVIYANDCSTKDNPCRLEIMLKRPEFFEEHIHKHIQKTVNYRYYAIKRKKSESADKDVEVEILVPNLLDLMNDWLDWRKSVETKMINRDISVNHNKHIRTLTKLSAVNNLDIVKTALESDDPVNYIATNLPFLIKHDNKEEIQMCSEYLMDQKLLSLRKLDKNKLESDIQECIDNEKRLNDDLNNINRVVLRELDNLSKFYKPRVLKI